MTMLVWVASNHGAVHQNRYRFNPERAYWEFDDGRGPWARSGQFENDDQARGEVRLARWAWIQVEDAYAFKGNQP